MASSLGFLTRRGAAFLMLGVLASLSGSVLGYEDLTRIGLLLVALPVALGLWLHARSQRLTVTRDIEPARVAIGGQATVAVHVRNIGGRTIPLSMVEDACDPQLGQQTRVVLPPIRTQAHHSFRYDVLGHHRGAYRVGPLTWQAQDPFGLVNRRIRSAERDEILVLPRVEPLASAPNGGQGRGSEGEQPQMLALHGLDDVSIRPYRDGDELRRVHWPATAHRGDLMVRQEDQPARKRAVLILDTRDQSQPGWDPQPTFEWLVSAVASIGVHLAREGYAIHLVTSETAKAGSASLGLEADDLLGALARVRMHGRTRVESVAAAAHPYTTGGALVVAAFIDDGSEDLRGLAALPRSRRQALALVAPSPGSPSGEALPMLDASGWATYTATPGASMSVGWEALRFGAAR